VTYTPAFLPLLAARNLLLVVVTVRAVRRSPALACAASEALGAGDHAQMPQIVEETSGMSGRGRPRPYDRIPQRLTAVWDHALASVRSRLGSFIPRRASLIPASKFLVVGGLGALVNTGVLALLYHYGHFALVAASAVATEMAIAHNFLWNNYWTFGRRSVSLSRFARFNLVSLAGQGITVATLWILVQHTTLHYIVANLAGIGLALAWNFTVSVRWTWARRN